jgi:hypothetical protein
MKPFNNLNACSRTQQMAIIEALMGKSTSLRVYFYVLIIKQFLDTENPAM